MSKARLPEQQTCSQCGYISSQEICKVRQMWLMTRHSDIIHYCCQACVLLAGLNKGLPQLGVGKSSKHRKTVNQLILGRDPDDKGGRAESAVAHAKRAVGKISGDIEDMR